MRLALRILLIATAVLLLGREILRHHSHGSTGVYVGLHLLPSKNGCGDSSTIALHIFDRHKVKINSGLVPVDSLAGRLKDIFSQRFNHVLFVRADPDVSFQDVVGFIDLAQGAVPDLQPILLTPDGGKREPCLVIEQDKMAMAIPLATAH
jgi:hypothetical protein